MISLRALGKNSTTFDGLDTISLVGNVDTIQFVSDELTAVCPVTGQPDFYTVSITLTLTSVTIETKTLKLFLRSFDGVGIFAEHLAMKIRDQIWTTVNPPDDLDLPCYRVDVELKQKSRGGIETTICSSMSAESIL